MRNKVEVFTLDRDSLKLGLGLSQLFYHNSSKAECGMAIRTHLILLLLRAVPRSLGWLDAFFLVVYASDVSFLVLLLWSVFRCVCCSVSSLEVLISTVLSARSLLVTLVRPLPGPCLHEAVTHGTLLFLYEILRRNLLASDVRGLKTPSGMKRLI